MSVRILHCGSSIENYELCISEKVAGFINRSAEKGDLVYLAVKLNGNSYCGARGVLSELTDYKPWPDADVYSHCLTLANIEFCKPFDIRILSTVGGQYWPLKYVQQAKRLDDAATSLMEKCFKKAQVKDYIEISSVFKSTYSNAGNKKNSAEPSAPFEVTNGTVVTASGEEEEDDLFSVSDEVLNAEIQGELLAVPDEKINIMATFQTVQFLNETHKFKGLESLVNSNFYPLFPVYPESRTLLIPENRMFKTKGHEDFKNVTGIRSLPDGLLIVYNKDLKNRLQINLIEYECYGERKAKPHDKSNFFNGQIIPQLMKFASSFSIVTDKNIRNETIKLWKSKVIDYINSTRELEEKFASWIREMEPEIPERMIGLRMSELLEEAFKNNVRILLIIDELSSEQKETLNNVINAFKLENGESIKFQSYVVRLVQQISVIDSTQEYALTVQ